MDTSLRRYYPWFAVLGLLVGGLVIVAYYKDQFREWRSWQQVFRKQELANRVHPPNPAKAPWYFLGLQELVAYSALWGGVIVPGLLVTALVLLPYLDRSRRGLGVWFARERKVALTLFTLCLIAAVVFTTIGSLFRGPNWSFQVPWKPIPAEEQAFH